jgi:hypothetical protein
MVNRNKQGHGAVFGVSVGSGRGLLWAAWGVYGLWAFERARWGVGGVRAAAHPLYRYPHLVGRLRGERRMGNRQTNEEEHVSNTDTINHKSQK